MPPYSQTSKGRREYHATRKEQVNAERRRRYAEDAEYRAQRLEWSAQTRVTHKETLNQRDRERAAKSLVIRSKVRCVRCGYDRSPVALQWHHTDPSTKTANPSSFLRWSDDRAIEELLTCVLVCANCHWEVESNLWVITDEHIDQSRGFVLDAYRSKNGHDYRRADVESSTVPPESAQG